MKTKLIISLIGLCLIVWGGCSSRQQQVYSEWSLQARATGYYLYENNGELLMGEKPAGDAYLWVMEACPGEEVRIKNKKSGHYLQTHDSALNCAPSEQADSPAAQWRYGGFNISQMRNCSWYTLENAAAGEGKYLTEANGKAVLAVADRNTDFGAHWTLVREKGTLLPFAISADSVQDASFLGLRTARALSSTEVVSDYHGEGNRWKLQKDLSGLPAFSAPGNQMVAALYNMALEEMLMNVRTDTTFMTGALWPDTWTRDAVYSIYFSFAWIMPEMSRRTLDKQTLSNPREALQDTGSGGSWPISTDRVVWAMAAWEYYLSSGDKAWLAEAYEGLSNTARKDIHVAFDEQVNLFKGETCSMDWRTHSYPNWFSNALIGESFSSGTNALHLFMYDFLGKAGKILNKETEEVGFWNTYHQRLKEGINKHFWNESTGLYTCYLYPQHMGYRSTQRVGAMSNGLCALLGAASDEQTRRLVENFPLYPYGAAVLYPTIPDDFAYHNKGIWAVWQTPYMYAAKSTGNMPAMEHMMKSLIRQGAMFLTHKENMTHDTGFDNNTALNSSRQLWSVSAYISMVYRILFGLELSETGISFQPSVPEWMNGPLSLEGFRYRDAVLNIQVTGQGNVVKSLRVNGEPQRLPFELPAGQSGHYNIEIEMVAAADQPAKMTLVEAGPGKCWSPVEPVLYAEGSRITWEQLPGTTYQLCGNGVSKPVTSPYDLSQERPGYYSVYAVGANGFESDLSNPILHTPFIRTYEAEEAQFKAATAHASKGYSGSGYVIDYVGKTADIRFTIDLPEAGDYQFTLRGANGYGPDGTYCAIRSAFMDGQDVGTFLLEATGNWEQWTESNHLFLRNLPAGKHTLQLLLNPESKGYDSNMSTKKTNRNDCHIDYLKVVKR